MKGSGPHYQLIHYYIARQVEQYITLFNECIEHAPTERLVNYIFSPKIERSNLNFIMP